MSQLNIALKLLAIVICGSFVVADTVGAYNGIRRGQTVGEINDGAIRGGYSPPPSDRLIRIACFSFFGIWLWRIGDKVDED